MTSTTSTKTPAQKPARKAPAKTAAKAPAKKATTEAAPKIRWTPNGEKDKSGNRPAVGVCGDREYAITGADDAWKATVKVGGKTTVLAENVGGKAAWSKCVKHNTEAQNPA